MTTGRLHAFRIAAFVTLFAVAGCSGSKTATFVDVEGFCPDQIYERGEYEVDRGRFADAAFFFSEVERLYPYSEWAQRAMMNHLLSMLMVYGSMVVLMVKRKVQSMPSMLVAGPMMDSRGR